MEIDLDALTKRLSSDDDRVAKDEEKLARDQRRASTVDDRKAKQLEEFANKLGGTIQLQTGQSDNDPRQAFAQRVLGSQQLATSAPTPLAGALARNDGMTALPPAPAAPVVQGQRGPMLNFSMGSGDEAEPVPAPPPRERSRVEVGPITIGQSTPAAPTSEPTNEQLQADAGGPSAGPGGMWAPDVAQRAQVAHDRSVAAAEAKAANDNANAAAQPANQNGDPAAMMPMAPPPPPVQPPRYVPAGWDMSRVPVRKSTLEAEDKARQQQADADLARNRAQQAGYDATAQHYENVAHELQERNAQWQAAEGQRQQRVADVRVAAQRAADQAGNLRVDPGQWMRNANTSTQLAVMVGSGMGGFLAGMKGGRNEFIDTLNGVIDRDIKGQETNVRLAKEGAAEKWKAYDAIRQDVGDERIADLTMRNNYMAYAENLVKAQLAKTQTAVEKANGLRMLADLQASRAQTQEQIDRMAYVGAHTVGGGGGGGQPQKGALFIKTPDGRVLKAPNDQVYNKLSEKSGLVSNIQANINKALALRKSASAFELANPYSSVHKQLKSLQAETDQMVTVARGQGAMSEGDKAVADEATGAMTGIMNNNDEVLRATSQRWGEQFARDANALGAEHVTTGYGYDANGRLTPTYEYVGQADRPAPNAMPKGAKPLMPTGTGGR